MSSLYKNNYKSDFNLFSLHSTFLQIVSKTTTSSDVNQVLIFAYTLKKVFLSWEVTFIYKQHKVTQTACWR